MQVTNARIVAETGPCVHDLGFLRGSKSAEVGKSPHPSVIIVDDGGNLCLLQHDFGDEDGVGIHRAAPWQVTCVCAKPSGKPGANTRRVQEHPPLLALHSQSAML